MERAPHYLLHQTCLIRPYCYIDVVPKAKVLGLTLSSNLKWNNHVDEIMKKSRKRLYCLSQLKRSGLKPPELIQFYRTCIRPITEYASPVFHDCLPAGSYKILERRGPKSLKKVGGRGSWAPPLNPPLHVLQQGLITYCFHHYFNLVYCYFSTYFYNYYMYLNIYHMCCS